MLACQQGWKSARSQQPAVLLSKRAEGSPANTCVLRNTVLVGSCSPSVPRPGSV